MELPLKWRVFETAARRLSFSRAAEELFISQPAVTKQIKDLEAELGVPLFERNGNRGIGLTTYGHSFQGFMDKVNLLRQDLESSFHVSGQKWEGEISIGASSTIGQYVLPALLAKFHQRFPDIKVHLMIGNTEEVIQALQHKQIIFAITEGLEQNTALHYENFLKDEIVLVCNTKSRFAQHKTVSLDKLKKMPIVMREFGSGTLDVITNFLHSKEVEMKEFNVVMQLSNTESIKSYVLEGDSVAFVSIHAVTRELMQDQLQILDLKEGSVERIFRFVTNVGPLSPLANVLRKFIKNEFIRKS